MNNKKELLALGGGGGIKAGGWSFRVYVRVRLLGRESSTCGEVGWLPTRWVEGEEGAGPVRHLQSLWTEWAAPDFAHASAIAAEDPPYTVPQSCSIVAYIVSGPDRGGPGARFPKGPNPKGIPVSLFQPTVIVPHAHWEAYGRGSLPLHHVVSDSANPHYVSDPLPQSFVGSS